MIVSTGQSVQIAHDVFAAIVAHARAGKPEEVCGIVRGRGLHALEAVRGRNIAAERTENYEVDPQTLLRQFDFEEQGDEMMGIYHSHPVSVAYPSATDAWNAHYPECVYFICSLEHDAEPVLRAFRLTPHWIEVELGRLRSEVTFHETRPGLFAYYQDAQQPVPPAVAPLAELVPFYVDYFVDDHGDVVDSRIVSVREHPVVVV